MPGGTDGSLPPRGARVAMTYGEPVHLDPVPWPRTQQLVADAAARVTNAIIETMREAELRTGMTLPGPPGPSRETPTKKSA
jgi:1-acyl-sn-glycerol-3-phosphate acyltransferase